MAIKLVDLFYSDYSHEFVNKLNILKSLALQVFFGDPLAGRIMISYLVTLLISQALPDKES
jgi:hypothetical protein